MIDTNNFQITDVAAHELWIRIRTVRNDDSLEWAENYWRNNAYAKHKGDCSKAEHQGPVTCDRCVCDEFREDAIAVINAANSDEAP